MFEQQMLFFSKYMTGLVDIRNLL